MQVREVFYSNLRPTIGCLHIFLLLNWRRLPYCLDVQFAFNWQCYMSQDKLLYSWWILLLCGWYTFFFLQDCGTYCSQSYAYFLVLSSRLSVIHTICLHFYFFVSRPGMGGRQFPSVSFCLYVVALNVIARALCGVLNARAAALCFSCSLQNISNSDEQLWMKLDDQWVLIVTKRPVGEIWTPYSWLVTALFPVYAQ